MMNNFEKLVESFYKDFQRRIFSNIYMTAIEEFINEKIHDEEFQKILLRKDFLNVYLSQACNDICHVHFVTQQLYGFDKSILLNKVKSEV